MGFFQTFWSWLNATLTGYIGDNTARVAAALEPAVVTLTTIYVMVWGYLHLTGRIEEALASGLKRILVMTIVLGVGLQLWLYNSVIVDTFYLAPAQLAAAVVGSTDPVASVDAIWQQGGAVAELFWNKAGYFSDWGNCIAAVLVYVLIGMLCVYAMFLIALSSIASAVLLAIGPLFITMLLFDSTRRYVEAWVSQLATYALILILTVLIAALLLQIVASYAAQTAARGDAILTVDALDMLLMAMLVFLLMRQIMPIAGGLAGGLALSSFGMVSRAISWGLGASQGRGARMLAATALGCGADRATAASLSWRQP